MKKIINKLKSFQSWDYVFVVLIILFGIFLRTYNFSDWLHFEVDQYYDINSVSKAVSDGIEQLPLLGPVAAGGPLRLGPFFYYLEYFGAKIIGNNPVGHASSVLFFSILSLPLFYFFCRRYFSKFIAVLLIFIYAVSFYQILYSRFSWNPNILPFFILLLLYALMRSVSPEEKKRDLWFIISISSVAIITQLHFIALIAFPLILAVFFIAKRPRFSWKAYLISIGIIVLLYLPPILSDFRTGGENLRSFISKFSQNSSGEADKKNEIIEKAVQLFRYDALEYFLVISGNDQINSGRPDGYSLGLFCNSCKSRLPIRITAYAYFTLGTIILLFNFLIKEKNQEKKTFLLLSTLWLAVASFAFFMIMNGGMYLYPRFFLIVSPLAIILLGFILEKIISINKISGLVFSIGLVAVLGYSNLTKVASGFSQLDRSLFEKAEIETEDVFPESARVTLEQQEVIIEYIVAQSKVNGYPIYVISESEYEPAFWYQFEKKGIKNFDALNSEAMYAQGNYFIVFRTFLIDEKNKKIKSYQELFDFSEKKDFGSLTVYRVFPKKELIKEGIQKVYKEKIFYQPEKSRDPLTWKEIFNN